ELDFQPVVHQALLRNEEAQRLLRSRDRPEARGARERAGPLPARGEQGAAAQPGVPARRRLLEVVQLLRHHRDEVSGGQLATAAAPPPPAAARAAGLAGPSGTLLLPPPQLGVSGGLPAARRLRFSGAVQREPRRRSL